MFRSFLLTACASVALTLASAAQATTFAWDTLTGATIGTGEVANIFGGATPVSTALVFQAGASGRVTAIDLALSLRALSEPGGAEFAVFTDGGAAPGTRLGNALGVTATSAPFMPDILSLTGWSGVTLTAGQTYWLVGTAAGRDDRVLWFAATPDIGGLRRFSTDGGTSWSAPLARIVPAARITVEATAVPLPATLPLALGGLAVLAALGRRRRTRPMAGAPSNRA